jgi:hypothetical protein
VVVQTGCGPMQVVYSMVSISGSVSNVDIRELHASAYSSPTSKSSTTIQPSIILAMIYADNSVKEKTRQRLACRVGKCMYLSPPLSHKQQNEKDICLALRVSVFRVYDRAADVPRRALRSVLHRVGQICPSQVKDSCLQQEMSPRENRSYRMSSSCTTCMHLSSVRNATWVCISFLVVLHMYVRRFDIWSAAAVSREMPSTRTAELYSTRCSVWPCLFAYKRLGHDK